MWQNMLELAEGEGGSEEEHEPPRETREVVAEREGVCGGDRVGGGGRGRLERLGVAVTEEVEEEAGRRGGGGGGWGEALLGLRDWARATETGVDARLWD